MNDKPSIPLSYHTPDRRPRFTINRRGVLTLLFIFTLCAAIGSWREQRARKAREAEFQALLNTINNGQPIQFVQDTPAAPPTTPRSRWKFWLH